MPNLSVLVTECDKINCQKNVRAAVKQTAARKQNYLKQSADVRLYAL